jgi:hypothetical protein
MAPSELTERVRRFNSLHRHYLPSFVRKDSLKRPKLEEHFSSRSQLSLGTPTSDTASPIFSDATPATPSRKKSSRKGSIVSLADVNSPSASPITPAPERKSSLTLAPGSGFGWGKVIRDGKLLSVSTLVGGLKTSNSPPSAVTAPPVQPPMRRLDSTSRLAELRGLMLAEPDGGLDY